MNTFNFFKTKVEVEIVKEKKQGIDSDYWFNKTYAERLEAIEIFREQYYLINKNSDRRVQRVCKIIKLK